MELSVTYPKAVYCNIHITVYMLQEVRTLAIDLDEENAGSATPEPDKSAATSSTKGKGKKSAAQSTSQTAKSQPESVVCFVDTPGQDIFYRMRNYGASVADVGLLVIAADEGVCELMGLFHEVCVL
jgi:translation initiation factor IF-2